MLRYVVIILLAVCIAGGVAYSGGWLDEILGIEQPPSNTGSGADIIKPPVDIGDLLYPAAAMPAIPKAQLRSTEQIVIDTGHVVPRDTQNVSSPKDGHLLFIGLEINEWNQNKLDPTRPLKQVEVYTGKEKKKFYYQPWEDGQYLDFDQMVAKVEPSLAIHEVFSKAAAIVAAQADSEATNSILKEALLKWERAKQLRSGPGGRQLVTDEELGAAEATVMKYKGEKVQKEEAINKAMYEKWQADIVLFTYDLRSKIEGKSIVKKKYKSNGEGIKAQEPILQLFGIDRLKIEGSVDSQYLAALRRHKTVPCYLEPSEEMAHYELQKAHRGEVTCVAFFADGSHFVSGSEDKTVCVWERGRPAPVTLEQTAPVRSVACSPKGMWLLVGCADGSISLWDLMRPAQPIKVLKDQHRGPVAALAFSPDASYFASGGEDNAIILYKADGEPLYPFDSDYGVDDPHQGTITSLYFTPQCKLVLGLRDNTLRVWELHQKGAKPAHAPITNRGGTVNHLGVSADGAYMLFDKGKTIQLLNTADGSTVCALDNLAGSNPFDTLAIFSPDGTLMLTGGAGEGRLQLWKKPTPDERAYQVRELVAKDRSAITSAAFAPAIAGQQRYAVSGSKEGHVHLWALPDHDTVNNHRIMVDAEGKPLTIWVEEAIEGGKTRISVNVLNPQSSPGNYRLLPGKRVTIVVNLPQAK